MDKMILMAGGHEIWLEASKAKGNESEVTLAYGHNMRIDGTPDPARLMPAVYFTGGKKLAAELQSKDDRHVLKFKGNGSGYYVPTVDLSPVILTNTKDKNYQRGPKKAYKDAIYAGAFNQMAKTVIPQGKAGKYKAEHVHGILDILPKSLDLKVGGVAELKVLYEGKPLVDAEVKSVSKAEGKTIATVVTNKDGVALLPITTGGLWMYLVRHKDPSKGVKDEYDEAVYVTTLTLDAS